MQASPRMNSSSQSITSAHQHILALDGMRGIAASCVVAHHAGLIGQFPAGHGYLAVDFFFVLSGFVIEKAYVPRLISFPAALRFCRDRIVRLYPTIAVGLLLGAMAMALGASQAHAPVAALLSQFTLIPLTSGVILFSLNDPLWSIFYEIIINFLHAFLVRVLTLPVLACVVMAASVAFLFMIFSNPQRGAGWGFENSFPSFEFGAARVAFSYFLGVIICMLTERRWLTRYRIIPFWALCLALFFLLCGPSLGPRPSTDVVAIFLSFPIIVRLGLTAPIPKPLMRPVKWLGSISFPLYATHFPILKIAGHMLPKHMPAAWIPVFLICLVVATLVENGVDAPVRAYLRSSKLRLPNA